MTIFVITDWLIILPYTLTRLFCSAEWSWKREWRFSGLVPATPLSGLSARMWGAKATAWWLCTAAGRSPATISKGQQIHYFLLRNTSSFGYLSEMIRRYECLSSRSVMFQLFQMFTVFCIKQNTYWHLRDLPSLPYKLTDVLQLNLH